MPGKEKIMKIKEKFSMNEILNESGPMYFKAENMKVSRYSGFDDWRITDLTNALVPGKDCIEYCLKSENGPHGNLDTTNFILSKFGDDLKALWNFCESLELVGYDSFTTKGIIIYHSTEKGIRVFSPFNLNQVKPLKSMPKKWTLSHVRSAIINNQFKDLKCNYVLTDDYAYDSAVNFRKGAIKASLEFIKDIIECPNGWWTSYRNGVVAVCCHTFDSNEFTPVIN